MTVSSPRVRTLFRSNLIHVFDYRCAGHDDKGEIPQNHEIVLPRSGAYQRRDAHGSFLADPNQVLFYNQGEPYDISHPFHGGDSSTIFVFAPSLLIEMIRAYDPDVENDPQKIFCRSHLTLATHLQILQYQFLRAGKNSVDTLEVEEQLITALDGIIQALYQEHAPKRKRSAKTARAQIEQLHSVKTFLNAHIHSNLQLEQISSAAYLSPFHLCRIFKQHTGMTLHQYVKRLRLFNLADALLENPAARLDLLARDYGFSNHGNFSTTFRQTFGFNPSEFRQMSKILKA